MGKGISPEHHSCPRLRTWLDLVHDRDVGAPVEDLERGADSLELEPCSG